MSIIKPSLVTFPHDRLAKSPSLAIDLVDACNLACPTCPRGLRYMRNQRVKMNYELFTKIIDKSERLGVRHICLYNWTEPFLCDDLYKYCKYVKKKNLYLQLSSNLSFPYIPNIIESLKFCDRLIVSVSGFSQNI